MKRYINDMSGFRYGRPSQYSPTTTSAPYEYRRMSRKFPTRINSDGDEEPITPPLPTRNLPTQDEYGLDLSLGRDEFRVENRYYSTTPSLTYNQSSSSSFSPPEPMTPPLPPCEDLPSVLSPASAKRGKRKCRSPRDWRQRELQRLQSERDVAHNELAKFRHETIQLRADIEHHISEKKTLSAENKVLTNTVLEANDRSQVQHNRLAELYAENGDIKGRLQAENDSLKRARRENEESSSQREQLQIELGDARGRIEELEHQIADLKAPLFDAEYQTPRTLVDEALPSNSCYGGISYEANSWPQMTQDNSYNELYHNIPNNHWQEPMLLQTEEYLGQSYGTSQPRRNRPKRRFDCDRGTVLGYRMNRNWRQNPRKRAKLTSDQWQNQS